MRRPLAGPLPLVLAWRFLRGPRSRLLAGTSRAALVATALGVTAMVVAMALMTGYSEDLQEKLIGDNAAVGIYPLNPERAELDAESRDALTALPGVRAVRAVSYGRGSLAGADPDVSVGVTLRGVDPGAGTRAREEDLAAGEDGIPGAVLGEELARRLGAGRGDLLRLTVLGLRSGRPRFRYATLRLSGTFSSGVAEFDGSWLVVDRLLLNRLAGQGPASGLYELALEDPGQATRVAGRVEEILGEDFLVTDWRDLNKELFFALKLQKLLLFLGLALIVLVSIFNVASTLMILIRERMRDIGVLGAMGLAPRGLRWAFVLTGTLLGGAGTLLGVGVGALICWVLTTFELIRFEPEVAAIYFIDSVPFRVEGGDLLAVVSFALGLTVLGSLVPAWRAVRVEPAAAIRYE